MRIYLFIFMMLFSANGYTDDSTNYRLGAGDSISIFVYGESDLSMKVRLGDSGVINYPFVGKVVAKGKTLASLQAEIEDGLRGDYLINPKVSVTVDDYRSIFVNGAVNKPGGFPFEPGLTVEKAITLANGFTDRANRKKIYKIAEHDVSKTPVKVSLDSSIDAGDVIIIEESFF